MSEVPDGPAASWWDRSPIDWAQGPPAQILELLIRAFGDQWAIERLAAAVGFGLRPAPSRETPVREIWLRVLDEAAASGQVLDLVAEALADPAGDVFRPMIRRALGDKAFATEARRALRHGLPTSNEDLKILHAGVRAAESAPVDEPVGALQAITSPAAGLSDPSAYLQAILDATRRVAMIEVGGRPAGTGLLVGPDLLLTAAHVLNRRPWPPSTTADVVAVFDYVRACGRSPTDTGTRIGVAEFLCGSLPTDGEVSGKSLDWDAPADRLDFALLRLVRTVPPAAGTDGVTRGFYRLEPQPYAFDRASPLLIMQHPLGAFQLMSTVSQTPQCNGKGTRIRYRGNTLQGSSGSPVIDTNGRLVAIHHYSETGTNQGVPAAEIAKMILAGEYAALLSRAGSALRSAVDPLAVRELRGEPCVNRHLLREHISRMATGRTNRRLLITGERGTGVSWSFHFMSFVADNARASESLGAATPEGIEVIRVDLRDYRSVPVEHRCMRIAEDLTVDLGLRRPTEGIAQDARNVITIRKWIAGALRSTTKQRWIFFDSVDDDLVVRQGGVAEFLHAMLDLTKDAQIPLWVVVAGRDAEKAVATHAARAEKDTAVGLPRPEVEQWLCERVGEEGGVVDEAALARELTALFPAGRPAPFAEDTALRLPAVLQRLLKGTS